MFVSSVTSLHVPFLLVAATDSSEIFTNMRYYRSILDSPICWCACSDTSNGRRANRVSTTSHVSPTSITHTIKPLGTELATHQAQSISLPQSVSNLSIPATKTFSY